MPDALLSPSAAAYCLLVLACLVSLVFVLSAIWNAAPEDDDIYPDPDKEPRQ